MSYQLIGALLQMILENKTVKILYFDSLQKLHPSKFVRIQYWNSLGICLINIIFEPTNIVQILNI